MGSLEGMRLLLDTHIFLWGLLDPSRLSQRLAAELEAPSNQLWLSPISAWEALMLAERGRVVLRPDPLTWLRKALSTIPYKEAPVTHEVAVQSRVVDLPHQDPADRFIVATAVIYDLTLVTSDERILASGSCRTLPNRSPQSP